MKKFPFRRKCVKVRNPEKAIPLREYAKKQHVDESTVRYWLLIKKVRGYKISNRWYVYDYPPYEDFFLNHAWKE